MAARSAREPMIMYLQFGQKGGIRVRLIFNVFRTPTARVDFALLRAFDLLRSTAEKESSDLGTEVGGSRQYQFHLLARSTSGTIVPTRPVSALHGRLVQGAVLLADSFLCMATDFSLGPAVMAALAIISTGC
jgi:hypothetical protein